MASSSIFWIRFLVSSSILLKISCKFSIVGSLKNFETSTPYTKKMRLKVKEEKQRKRMRWYQRITTVCKNVIHFDKQKWRSSSSFPQNKTKQNYFSFGSICFLLSDVIWKFGFVWCQSSQQVKAWIGQHFCKLRNCDSVIVCDSVCKNFKVDLFFHFIDYWSVVISQVTKESIHVHHISRTNFLRRYWSKLFDGLIERTLTVSFCDSGIVQMWQFEMIHKRRFFLQQSIQWECLLWKNEKKTIEWEWVKEIWDVEVSIRLKSHCYC